MKHSICSLCLLVLASALVAQPIQAQSPRNPVEDSFPEILEPPPELPLAPEMPIQLEDETIPEVLPNEPVAVPSDPFFVEDIQVIGNTLFTQKIEEYVSDLEGREITLEELLTLRTYITKLYVEDGYASSGAFLPTNQELQSGVVQIQVIEGVVENVQITGLSRLRERYIRDRIARAIAPPLNVSRLQDSLRQLQVNPLLQSINADLIAGQGPGKSILLLDLREAYPLAVNLGVDNYRSPSIGELQGTAVVSHLNVLGWGDRLSAHYNLTEGLDVYEASYAVPVNRLEGTLQLRYANAESSIVTSEFEEAGIRSENETISVNFRQPLTRSLNNEFALGLGFDVRESRNFILDDQPFSFSVGPDDGVSKVRALRFSQEWVNRDTNTVLAARSQFSVGLDLFDATVNDTDTDAQFLAWLGQFQWVEQFSPNTLLVTRVNAQLTPDSLLSLERFSVGGISTVRGYAQNQIVTDNAITASAEVRLPLTEALQLTPFIDTGGGWNNRTPNPDLSFLLGLGLGVQWQPMEGLNLRLDYGIPLITPDDEGNSLQENGLYFSLNLKSF